MRQAPSHDRHQVGLKAISEHGEAERTTFGDSIKASPGDIMVPGFLSVPNRQIVGLKE